MMDFRWRGWQASGRAGGRAGGLAGRQAGRQAVQLTWELVELAVPQFGGLAAAASHCKTGSAGRVRACAPAREYWQGAGTQPGSLPAACLPAQ